nr:tail fiber protein [uncultured Microbacterium sp.]
MTEPFVGEIRTVGFSYAPLNWAMCNGQLLPISQNTALFAILGTNYGGDGRATFALPNLNGAFAIGRGRGPGLTERYVGEIGGARSVTLTQNEMPSHAHQANAVPAPGTSGDPQGRRWAQSRYGRAARETYAPTRDTSLAPDALAPAGGSLPHNNMPPYVGMYFVIALNGVFPPRP